MFNANNVLKHLILILLMLLGNLVNHGCPRAWVRGGAFAPSPSGNVESVFLLQMWSKTSVNEVFMHHFKKMSSASAHRGAAPGPCWGTSIVQTPLLPTPEKILRAPMSWATWSYCVNTRCMMCFCFHLLSCTMTVYCVLMFALQSIMHCYLMHQWWLYRW